ncbi:flavin-containing monooxygenase [Rhodococcus aetherivorans]
MTTDDLIKTAVEKADANALRLALYQATGDPELAEMPVEWVALRGGVFQWPSLSDEDIATVRTKAVDFLSDPANHGPRADVPSDPEMRRLMELFQGSPLTDSEFQAYRGEVALEEFPRDPRWSTPAAPGSLDNFNVLIVGAGASGIAMSIKLSRLGIKHTILERLDDLGGTWHRHRYPNVRVDTNFLLYQYKFEKRYVFDEYFPTQAAIKDYMDFVARKFGVDEHIVFGQEVVDARWDGTSSTWRVTANNAAGERTEYSANVLITATGLFATPKMPDFPGLESFAGDVVHTADWNQSLELDGKRIAVIGNGSTGTQILPKIAESAKHVTAFQRTPSWIVETPGLQRPVKEHTRWLLENMPYYWNWASYSQFIATLAMQEVQVTDPAWQASGGLISEKNDSLRKLLSDYVAEKVGHDPELVAKLVPTYAPLARRIVVDSGWYDALMRDNVDLNTDGVREIVPEGIVTNAGELIELDLIVAAAGFEVSRYFYPAEFHGRNGTNFDDLWSKDGARAFLGMSIPGFPNFYSIYGPNSQGRGGGGFLMYVDLWTQYVAEMLIAQIEGGFREVEVKKSAYDAYNEEIDEAVRGLIYESEGKGGYFVNEHGRSGVQMPWTVDEYYARLLPADISDYDVRR